MKLPTTGLMEGPTLLGQRTQYNDAQHLFIMNGSIVPCTPSEYAVLMPLLWAHGSVPLATFAELTAHRPLTRHVLACRMSTARAKLWPFGLDIVCVIGHGYMVIALPADRPVTVPGGNVPIAPPIAAFSLKKPQSLAGLLPQNASRMVHHLPSPQGGNP